MLRRVDLGLFGNRRVRESEKCSWDKDLGCVKVVGIMEICIVNARESEPKKLPGLTSVVPDKDSSR